MLKIFAAALFMASGLAIFASPAAALQVVVTQVEKGADSSTYHFTVKTDKGETLAPDDFVTVYNFYGLVDGSAKTPAGWTFSTQTFGRTPAMNGYPMVLPVDIPGTPNLTFTVTNPVAGGSEITGFTATTRAGGMTQGEYSGEVTRQSSAGASKQAVLGVLPSPTFLAQ